MSFDKHDPDKWVWATHYTLVDHWRTYSSRGEIRADFEDFLNEVRRKAWNEGHSTGTFDSTFLIHPLTPNPYDE